MPVSSALKASKIIGHWKAFYRQRILPSRCARKGTIDIDILVTGDPNIIIYSEAHAEFFFFKNLALLFSCIHGSLSLCKR